MEANRPTPKTPISSSPTPIWTARAGGSLPLSAPPIPEAKKAPAASHRITRPDEIGLRPITFCNQSGMANKIPNSPMEIIRAAIEPFLNELILNKPKSRRTFFFWVSRSLSHSTNTTAEITNIRSATGITEIPVVGHAKSPIMNWLLGFTSHQP